MNELVSLNQKLTPGNNLTIFEPMFCVYEDNHYSHFFPSKIQVAMCLDTWDENDPRIIEVDVRVASCVEDTTHFGIFHENGSISCIYENVSALIVCGPRSSWVPVNITDMRLIEAGENKQLRLVYENALY